VASGGAGVSSEWAARDINNGIMAPWRSMAAAAYQQSAA